ncbi:MAG: hypothetical protein ACLT33_12130 [Lachnospira pectinoschiza]
MRFHKDMNERYDISTNAQCHIERTDKVSVIDGKFHITSTGIIECRRQYDDILESFCITRKRCRVYCTDNKEALRSA